MILHPVLGQLGNGTQSIVKGMASGIKARGVTKIDIGALVSPTQAIQKLQLADNSSDQSCQNESMKTFSRFLPVLFFALAASASAADQKPAPSRPSLVNFPQFEKLSLEASEHRQKRLVKWEEFEEMAKDPKTIILDTRSREAFEQVHLKGSVHLNFSDFTEEKLAKVIPNKDTTILIYCNNNFTTRLDLQERFASLRDKAPPLALNIPTFINLYGYGYKNIYELSELLDVQDPRVELEGSSVKSDD